MHTCGVKCLLESIGRALKKILKGGSEDLNSLSLYIRAERKVVQVVLDTFLPHPFPNCFM